MDDNTRSVFMVALPLVVSLVTGMTTAYVAVKQAELSARVGKVAENVQQIELATNSMNDQLVDATDKAGFARGQEVERSEQKAREEGKITKETKAAVEMSKKKRAQYERDRAQYERERAQYERERDKLKGRGYEPY